MLFKISEREREIKQKKKQVVFSPNINHLKFLLFFTSFTFSLFFFSYHLRLIILFSYYIKNVIN